MKGIHFDFWYGHKLKDVTLIDAFFYPNERIYRGNIYINDKAIGDFYTDNSVALEKLFGKVTMRITI